MLRPLPASQTFMNNIYKRNSGFTLIETIIYIAIFSLITTTLISLAYSVSLQNESLLTAVFAAFENI
jgi:type II secretory pathway pseudopilin PulG